MKTVGDQELMLLRDIAEIGPSTVGEVAERFGEPRGLARIWQRVKDYFRLWPFRY